MHNPSALDLLPNMGAYLPQHRAQMDDMAVEVERAIALFQRACMAFVAPDHQVAAEPNILAPESPQALAPTPANDLEQRNRCFS